jgi:hypothetical protein
MVEASRGMVKMESVPAGDVPADDGQENWNPLLLSGLIHVASQFHYS